MNSKLLTKWKINGMVFLILFLNTINVLWAQNNGMIVLDGKPRFIIGNYHNPNEFDELKIYKQNGFNLVRCSATIQQLDMVQEAGLYAWVNTGNLIDFSKERDERSKKLTQLVDQLKDHPRFAVWEVPDEALWNISYPKLYQLFYSEGATPEQQDSILNILSERVPTIAKGFNLGCEKLKKLDPNHPIWMNHAPRNPLSELLLFSEAADIVGCDIYPEKEGLNGHSDLVNNSLSSVGEYTDFMQAAGPGKPVWMVLQAFSWELLQKLVPERLNPQAFPSYKHSRFMVWDAILHGAKGILYYGSYKVNSNSLFWNSILGVTREIAALEPFLIAPELKDKIKVEPIVFSSTHPTRVAYSLKKYEKNYLLVILQEDLSQSVDVSNLNWLEGKTLYELTSDRNYVVKDGKIRVWFSKEPHVLCTSKKYEVVHESEFPIVWDDKDNYPLNEK